MLEQYIGIGLVHARLLARLRDYDDSDFTISIAERSPLGPRAVRVRQTDALDGSRGIDFRNLGSWLEGQVWVEAIAVRPSHIYVRIGTETLRSWVVSESADHRLARGQEGCGQTVVIRCAAPSALQRSLDWFREAAVSRAIVALFTSRGYNVMLAPVDGSRGQLGHAMPSSHPGTGKVTAHMVVGSARLPDHGDIIRIPVGAVDVPHGPLRARYGGTVSADDLLVSIRNGSITEFRLNGGRMVSQDGNDRYDEASLAFVLLRTPRARRIQLDNAKLLGEAAAFDSVLTARRFSHPGVGLAATADVVPQSSAGGSERAVHDLAIELDLLSTVAARAANDLEPALLARYMRSLADRAHLARAYLPSDDPLWSAVGKAIDRALTLVGIEAPVLQSDNQQL
ncbi:MAG: hypothetical protein ETSY1_05055 [Candidatus Entotheonella factor]|uniref:Uncharacterized protein n=1 Tax=Entotheonella factor TaxID=1429438 RepID=W4LVW1_ENTF1|nr:MAG: hypothetical protein ETSY1_05055 [Candidatus Entotheonella factor]